MVKVLIDLRMVRGPLHGIARYALELARRIPLLEPGWLFQGLTGPEGIPDDLGALAPRIPLVRCSAGFLSVLEQPALTASLLAAQPTLFHATSFSLPALWPGRLVATIHDANHLALRESRSTARSAYYTLVVGPRARSARALITVSEFSRRELSEHLGLPPQRLQVISNGVSPLFRVPPQSQLEEFRARRALPPRYFAAVGGRKDHKNLAVLKDVVAQLPLPLVLLAGRGARRAFELPDQVVELSPVPDEDLVCLLAGATAVLVPSRYEGFGLPALEAMACGAPVVAANAGALPEVVGEAGLLVHPDVPSEWGDAARRLFRDDGLRRALGERGRERASRYSWDECARQTLEVYKRALG